MATLGCHLCCFETPWPSAVSSGTVSQLPSTASSHLRLRRAATGNAATAVGTKLVPDAKLCYGLAASPNALLLAVFVTFPSQSECMTSGNKFRAYVRGKVSYRLRPGCEDSAAQVRVHIIGHARNNM